MVLWGSMPFTECSFDDTVTISEGVGTGPFSTSIICSCTFSDDTSSVIFWIVATATTSAFCANSPGAIGPPNPAQATVQINCDNAPTNTTFMRFIAFPALLVRAAVISVNLEA
jgi:hypothetical protein